MQSTVFFTIVAKNYFALAKALTRSIQNAHPDADVYVLLVDAVDFAPEFATAGAVLTSPYEILDATTFEKMAYSYDVTELSTALKPFMLSHLIVLGYETVIYLDPDIVVFNPLSEVLTALAHNNIVVTPHLTAPLPFDGRQPDEITILQAGTYNLGFIAVRNTAETKRFLAWWALRLETMSVVDVAAGLFTDQKWVNLAPGIFSGVAILRSRGLNVAYWNLHERSIDAQDPTRLASGEPIVFFHFSGFNADTPSKLSKYQDRVNVEQEPGLAKLLARYAKQLTGAGHATFRTMRYGFATFSNGAPLDVFARRAFLAASRNGVRIERPGALSSSGSLFAWLNSPADRSATEHPPYYTNYLKSLYDNRSDLHQHFPDPSGSDRAGFFKWLRDDPNHGAAAAYVQAAYAHCERQTSAPSLSVNAVGYFKAASGTGEHARAHVAAIRGLGIPVKLIDVSHMTMSRLDDDSVAHSSGNALDGAINLVMVNADEVLNVRSVVGEKLFANRYNIAFWAWELPDFPADWHDRFAYFDEIWVGSTFVRDAVAKHSPIPVVRVPLVITLPPDTRPARARFGFRADEFVFLYVFDFLSVFERKNPLAAIDAFRRAFPNGEKVRLLLKFSNSNVDPVNRELLYRAAAADSRIELLDQYLSRDDKNALIASCDAYVSLHRAEGFGITVAEAMLLEKPVIATNWSGNVDFLNERNGYPVTYRLHPLENDIGPYKRGQIWAEPDVANAAAAMRSVRDDPDQARMRAARAANDVRRELSAGAVGAIIADRLSRATKMTAPGGGSLAYVVAP